MSELNIKKDLKVNFNYQFYHEVCRAWVMAKRPTNRMSHYAGFEVLLTLRSFFSPGSDAWCEMDFLIHLILGQSDIFHGDYHV